MTVDPRDNQKEVFGGYKSKNVRSAAFSPKNTGSQSRNSLKRQKSIVTPKQNRFAKPQTQSKSRLN